MRAGFGNAYTTTVGEDEIWVHLGASRGPLSKNRSPSMQGLRCDGIARFEAFYGHIYFAKGLTASHL